MRTIRNGILAVLALGALSAAQAQVTGALVAADQAAQPGKPLRMALKLEHEKGWHTYLLNPGIGKATSIRWELPVGWIAGEIEWPVPHTIRGADGGVTGNGYESTVYLPVTLSVPESTVPGESVKIEGKATWLMCSPEACIPGGSAVELMIPVAGSTTPNKDVSLALARMPMPKANDAWSVKAFSDGKLITVKIVGAGDLKSPHFFSKTELVSHDAEQKYDPKSGELTVTLPMDEYYESDRKILEGVLSYTDAYGQYVGVPIEVPLS